MKSVEWRWFAAILPKQINKPSNRLLIAKQKKNTSIRLERRRRVGEEDFWLIRLSIILISKALVLLIWELFRPTMKTPKN